MNLSLLLSLAALAQDAHVVVPASEVIRTLEEQAPPPQAEAPPVAWIVPSSTLVLRPGREMSEVALEVELVPVEPAWVSLPVLDGRVRLTQQSLPLHQGPDGSWWFTGFLSRPITLKVQGTLAVGGDSGQVASFKMAQAARQELRVEGKSGDRAIVGTVDGESVGAIAPRSSVNVAWSPERGQASSKAQVLQAQVNTAAWLDEGALRLRSQVRWEVRRGSYSQLRLSIPAGASEVDLTGTGLARWERQGNTLLIEPLEPIEGAMEVQVEWRQTFDKGSAQLSHPKPVDAGNATFNLTLAGDSETLLSPSASGMRAVAVEELPPKARAIGDAPANAAWTGPGTLSLKALKLNALDGPDLVVDLARCTAAQSFEGRTMMTCSLDVRNASKQFLGVGLPPGFSLWSARVNGEGVSPVRMDSGQMNVPLERSVETLAGLTAIAVELTFLGEEDSWGKKGERQHQLPSFDAPVARLEWELRLPPGYRAKAEGGSARLAGETTTELVYASAAEAQEAEQAREVWNKALDAYQDNDFDAAQAYVDQTLALDADNYNAVSLQSNLDVLSGDASGLDETDEAMTRRVKDMAKAKVADDEVKQEQKLAEADRLLNEGRYEEAIETYEEVEEMSKELARYEHKESKKQSYYGSSSSSGAAEARNRASSRDSALSLGQKKDAPVDSRRADRAPPEETVVAWGDAPAEDWAAYDEEDLRDLEGQVGELADGVFDSKSNLMLLEEEVLAAGNSGLAGGYLGGEGEANGLAGLGTKGYGAGGGGVEMDWEEPELAVVSEEKVVLSVDETVYSFESDDIDGDFLEPDDAELLQALGYLESADKVVNQPMAEPMPEPVQMREAERTVSVALESAEVSRSYETSVAAMPGVNSSGSGRGTRSSAPRSGSYAPAPKPAPPPPPVAPGKTRGEYASLDGKPAISATTLAIPLPDHGESVVVVQRLIEPGEAPTLTIRYRETR